jgi:hypothetical protein
MYKQKEKGTKEEKTIIGGAVAGVRWNLPKFRVEH